MASSTIATASTMVRLADKPSRVRSILRQHARLSIVERAGHMPWFDDSTPVAREIGDFLAG